MMGMLMICTHVEITSAGSALYAGDGGKGEAAREVMRMEITKEG
jgi:hypothetical protein